jgi:hypothetical protein
MGIQLSVKLRNGDSVTGVSEIKELVFNTAYGQLKLPVKDLSKIEFGLIYDEALKLKAEAYIDLMKTGIEADCKRAYDSLAAAEMGVITLLESQVDNDPSIYPEYSLGAALNFLKDKYMITDYNAYDIITLNGSYNFPGTCDISVVEIKTQFGELRIPRENIVFADVINDSGTGIRKFKLEANKNISANPDGGWMKTDIRLQKGQTFSIEAEGEVMLASLSNQMHKPSGSYLPPGGSWTAGNDNDPNALPIFGNVIYRIGESTAHYKAGTKLKATAPNSGMLYISIYETVFNAANTGSYQVKVSV